MGGLVDSAPACYGSSLCSNPGISKMGDISKGGANTLWLAKKIQKKIMRTEKMRLMIK
jgi:hypothetical protein